MARIEGSRIVLDARSSTLVNGWAILVHGRTMRDLIFVTKEAAQNAAALSNLAHCPIVPVAVVGDLVERLD